MNTNQRYQVTIEDLGEGGEGICRVDSLTVFVPEVVLGDQVEIEIIQLKKNYAIGRVTRLIESSPLRTVSPCPDFPECGGCQLLDMAYPAQLDWKQQHLAQVLQRIGGIEMAIEPIIGMDSPWHYRNKMTYPLNQSQVGLYRRGSHDIVEIRDCQVHPPGVGKILEIVRDHLGRTVEGYNEKTHRGGLRHVMVRHAADRNQLMIVLVTCDTTDLTPLISELSAITNVRTILENKNRTRGNRILGYETTTLYGDGVIEEVLGGDVFAIDPHSFYQVNTVQLKKLYHLVREFADLSGDELLYDIYAGMGTIGTYLSRDCRQVVSIEVVPQAIDAGIKAAKENQVGNIDFILGQAETIIDQLNQQGQKPDIVVVDPPRKGLDQQLIESLLEIRPEKIIYVSCKPSTLARDLKLLTAGEYIVQRIRPVDLFPHTTHVETVCLMSKKEK